jgi:hypothetical protein
MQGLDESPGRRLVVSDLAGEVIAGLFDEQGQQAIVLCWPRGAACLPLALHVPGEYEVVIRHIACCPIYVDVRQLGWSTARRAVLDVAESPRAGKRPVLRLHPVDGARSVVGAA